MIIFHIYRTRKINAAGFTLIELSIVLVIIGLIVGGVLTGRDLISASEVRAQITQIEKYNSAVNTFRGKFNAIPGDMRPEIASQFGFVVGTNCNDGTQGARDGNGLIDGWNYPGLLNQNAGETGLFWQDITSPSAGNLIEGQFPNSGASSVQCYLVAPNVSGTTVGEYLPVAKIGRGNFVYVYENGFTNWFGVSAVTQVANAALASNTNISVSQAYNIDKKIDDGIPNSGNVQALYLTVGLITAAPYASAVTNGTSWSCFDTVTNTYSITVNNGSGGNCALSFKMQ